MGRGGGGGEGEIILPDTLCAQVNQQGGQECPHLEERMKKAEELQLLLSAQSIWKYDLAVKLTES